MAHAPGIDRRRVDELTERELARSVAERVRLGTQFLMPTEDAVLVAEELARRWGMHRWWFTPSATQVNIEAIRLARAATGRPVLLMFDGKYHGHGEEMLVTLEGAREVPEGAGLRPGWKSTSASCPSTTSGRSPEGSSAETSRACSPSPRSRTRASCSPTRASTPVCDG